MAKKKVNLEEIDRKLNLLLKDVKKIKKEEKYIEKEEEIELEELRKLEEIEEKIKKGVGVHPLRKITYRDLAKGALGAFIGVVAHYTFIYGIHVAEDIDIFRATLLFPIAYLLGGVFLYATGFRKVSTKMLWFLPVRLTVLFVISLIMAVLVLYLFHPDFMQHFFWNGYKQVATVTLTGIIGACTADLIGRE